MCLMFVKKRCNLLVLRRILLLSIALFESGCLVLYVKIIQDSHKVEDDFLALACLAIQIPASVMIAIFSIVDLLMTTKIGRITCNCDEDCFKYCCSCFKERFCDDTKPKNAANSACLCKCISCANGPAIGMLICFMLIAKARPEILYIGLAVIAKLISVLGMALQYSVQRLIKREHEKYSLFGEDQGLTKTVHFDAENINLTIVPQEHNINVAEARESIEEESNLPLREGGLGMDNLAMETSINEAHQVPKTVNV